jgi:heme exporter protein C
MLWPLLVMALATHLYFFASLLGRTRTGLLSLESGKQWVRVLVDAQPAQTTGAPT